MKTKSKPKPGPKPGPKPPVVLPVGIDPLLSYREIAAAIGFSERFVKRMVSTGEYPAPDTRISNEPRWTVATHNAWLVARCAKKV